MENVDEKMKPKVHKIGVFDSGIGGFSVLSDLMVAFPEAHFYYYSDDAHAPYGPKTDEYITNRTFIITDELLLKGAQMIVVACNTATASSIDKLREHYPKMVFVGVEPYLKAYFKETGPSKMIVLTTESTGKSQRFKRLKERIDPEGFIDHHCLSHLARMIENFYRDPSDEAEFDRLLEIELRPLKDKNYTHAILGCTHYPLIKDKIEAVLNLKTLSPSPYVAQRVHDLLVKADQVKAPVSSTFDFYSSSKPQWEERSRNTFFGPFKK